MKDSRKTDSGSVDDMRLLQNLILGEEKERLHKLDRRVSDLESRTNDVAEVLPAAMNRVAGDPGSRPEFEKPVVSTIRSAIKRDTQSFAEALFPVLGPAIRRAVADALKSLVQRINVVLENSFTVKGLRWRLESARTGVPFAQIILRHTMRYAIQEAFLIQRGSGLVLASVHRDESLALDEDAVASMLTAIQSFIQDSFGVASDEALRSAEMGGQTMWVINGPVAVLACIITGTPPRTVRDELMDLLETLHARYGQQFRDRPENLAGNDGLNALMLETLREEADEQVQSSTRFKYKLIWAAGSILLLLYLLFTSINAYRDRQFTRQVESLFKSQPGYVVTESSMADGVLSLGGLRDPAAQGVQQLLNSNEIQADKVQLDFRPYQSLEPAIVEQRIRQQMQIEPQTSLELTGNELVVTGTLTGPQLSGLRDLPRTHVFIQSVNLDATKYPADAAVKDIRQALSAPDSVNFVPAGGTMKVTGISDAGWYATATNAEIYSGGWPLDFTPLQANLATETESLLQQLDGSIFHFIDGIRLTNEAEESLQETALDLVNLQALALALDQDLSVSLEGLGDGIDTYEKNREVARMRSNRVLDELVSRGVNPAGITHVVGEWQEGGLNLERRKVTLRIEGNAMP